LAARIDRIIRAFAIAPAIQRTINISDGTVSATQIYRLARTVLDKNNAGLWRAAWLSGDEGQRLLMYRGLLKTLGVGMGLNLSAEGRLILSRIDDMSKQLYSPSQNTLELGDDLAKALKTLNSGGKIGEPKGVRKKVQDAIAKTSAENKANRLIASVSEKIKEYTIRLKALRIDLKDARNSGDTVREAAIRQEIKIVGAKLGPQLNIKKELKLAFKKDEEGLFENIDDNKTGAPTERNVEEKVDEPGRVEESITPISIKNRELMVDSLKLAQTSKTSLVKLIDLLLKISDNKGSGVEAPLSFDDLDKDN
jgi:hypothetical protein